MNRSSNALGSSVYSLERSVTVLFEKNNKGEREEENYGCVFASIMILYYEIVNPKIKNGTKR